jgi:hypothetical protein
MRARVTKDLILRHGFNLRLHRICSNRCYLRRDETGCRLKRLPEC